MRFNKKFKEAFNAKYNYSNEEFEAKIRVTENTKKTFKPKLRYSMTLILTTMILTAVLSMVLFKVWLSYNDRSTDNIEEKIAEKFNAKHASFISKNGNNKYIINLYNVAFHDKNSDIALFFEGYFENDLPKIVLKVNINEITKEIEITERITILQLNLINQCGTLSVDVYINDKFECNFTQIIDKIN